MRPAVCSSSHLPSSHARSLDCSIASLWRPHSLCSVDKKAGSESPASASAPFTTWTFSASAFSIAANLRSDDKTKGSVLAVYNVEW